MPPTVTEEDASYARDIVARICREVGPGVPGSPQERRRAAMIGAELQSLLGAENVVTEEFTLAPGAFLGSLRLSAALMLAAALLNVVAGHVAGAMRLVLEVAALALSVGALLAFFLEYMRYAEFVDFLFPKRQSVNVIGTLRRPGAREAKRLLILGGHHDSAQENNWFRLLGYGFYVTIPTIIFGLVAVLAASAVQFAGMVAGSAGVVRAGTLGWVVLAYPVLPAAVFAIFFCRSGKNGGTVPGAADNLSACALAAAMCRFLVRNPSYIPDDTEIRFISFGAEEAGLRGSRRYVERHIEELKRLDARLLNYETVAHPEIAIPTSDVHGVKNRPEMVASVAAAAVRAGVPHRVKPYPAGGGGSDAGPFSLAGLRALTLLPFKVPQQIVAFYHQSRDTPEVLTMEPLLNVLKLTFEWVLHGGD